MTPGEERGAGVAAFLSAAGWGRARRQSLAGDASSRRYERLTGPTGTAVLMDAGPAGEDQTRRFASLALWLAERGYSAPRVLAAAEDRGLLLLEDLGDDLVARVVRRDPSLEGPLYRLATDFLSDLGGHQPPATVGSLDAEALGDLLRLTETVYATAAGSEPAFGLAATMAELARPLDQIPKVLSLRDFHAENLLWLPDRAGLARLGLLDFQDAVAAHPAYDLISLTRDARRDVPAGLAAGLADRFCRRNRHDSGQFAADCALLGAHRSLRILGVFARLATEDAKLSYLDLMPRVWSYLRRDLAMPALAPLRDLVLRCLPEPTPAVLDRIRSRCPTSLPQ